MRLCKIEINGQTYRLCLNGAALFDIYDKFGTKGFITDPLKDNNKSGFEATCFFLAKLCEQGELYRRWQGQTRGPVLSEQYFRVHLAPRDVYRAKDAIVTAIRIGFAREAEEPHDVDLGLVELQKKTESP